MRVTVYPVHAAIVLRLSGTPWRELYGLPAMKPRRPGADEQPRNGPDWYYWRRGVAVDEEEKR